MTYPPHHTHTRTHTSGMMVHQVSTMLQACKAIYLPGKRVKSERQETDSEEVLKAMDIDKRKLPGSPPSSLSCLHAPFTEATGAFAERMFIGNSLHGELYAVGMPTVTEENFSFKVDHIIRLTPVPKWIFKEDSLDQIHRDRTRKEQSDRMDTTYSYFQKGLPNS